jgi:hypothetical protein
MYRHFFVMTRFLDGTGEEIRLVAPKEQARSEEAYLSKADPYLLCAVVCALARWGVKPRCVAETDAKQQGESRLPETSSVAALPA